MQKVSFFAEKNSKIKKTFSQRGIYGKRTRENPKKAGKESGSRM